MANVFAHGALNVGEEWLSVMIQAGKMATWCARLLGLAASSGVALIAFPSITVAVTVAM
jgi:hypothetical protein